MGHEYVNSDTQNIEQIADRSTGQQYVLQADLPDHPALQEIKQIHRWVAWQYEVKNGRLTKMPKSPANGRNASVSDPFTWSGYEQARAAQIKHGFAGVGFVLVSGDNLCGGDLDHCLDWCGDLPKETYWEYSPSGEGIRFLFRGDPETLKCDPAGVEIYKHGRFLTITGNHVKGSPLEINEAPATLAALTARVAAYKAADVPAQSLAERATAAIRPPAGTGFKNDTGREKSGFWRAVNDAAMADLDRWAPALFPQARKHATGAWRITSADLGRDLEEDLSIHPDGITDHGEERSLTPINVVQEHGGKDAKDAAFWLCDRLGIDPTTLGWQQPSIAAHAIGGSDDIDLIHNKRGHPAWCAENACLILETASDWAGVLAYNEETALMLLLRPIPGSKTPKAGFKPRPITDADLTATLRWFNRNGFPDATRNIVADAVFATAAQSVIAPVRHYLEALSWDGVERISTWLSVYGGADDLPITRRMGRAWMIAAVARALQPGCKADCALILEGGQGVGKSSAARVLASEDWFSDSLRDLDSKDASAALRGRWIIELPELSAVRRSATEAVKAFLSRTEERYRPAYGRTEVIEPRRCVFIGTTNRTDYLNDDTGNRRFWPVSIRRFDLDALRRDRDQLWAEAVAAYRTGEPWWLDREAETEAAALTSQRQADDPWESKVLEAVIGKAHTSTRALLDAIGLDPVHRTKADSMRVAGILNRAGWVRDGKYSSGPDRGQARYVRPPSGEPQWGTS